MLSSSRKRFRTPKRTAVCGISCIRPTAPLLETASGFQPDLPSARLSDARAKYSGEVLGCGERGSMVVFNGAIWHGHTANVTPDSRRSIQGYFVRRSARSGFDFRNRPLPTARRRISPLARYLLALDDETQ